MDLLSGHSPSSSVSPPISPIKVFSQPGISLPPLKSLPVWNRTGLEKNRFIRSITKDSPESTKTEILLSHLTNKSTQTSPPSTALGNIPPRHSEIRHIDKHHSGDGSAAMGTDRKLYFLQAEHEGVLKKLHIELENLKSKNREMTFKLTMTNNALSVSHNGKDAAKDSCHQGSIRKPDQLSSAHNEAGDKNIDGRRDYYKDEINMHRSSFKSAGIRKSAESNEKPITKSAKYSKPEQRKNPPRHQSGNVPTQQPRNDERLVRQDMRLLQGEPIIQSKAAALITGKKYSSEDYEEIIRDLKRLNAKQASELVHLKEKLMNQTIRSDDSDIASSNRLPKLEHQKASKSAKANSGTHSKHEILTLPALRPILGTKVINRQRKAQASHVQRQRSNRDIMQKII